MKKSNISGFVSLVVAVLVLVLSLSGMTLAFKGDLKEDGCINWLDIDTFASKWLNDCNSANNWCDGADINHSNEADFGDFGLLAECWLEIGAGDHNLVGHWKLDETGGGTAYDSSGNDYNGTRVGAAWEPGGGQIDGAARFAGGSQRIEIPTDGMSASAGTVVLWGRPEGAQTQYYRYFFACRDMPGGGNRVQLYLYKETMQLGAGLGDTYNLNTSIMTLSTDTWYHIALTWDGTNYIVYVDANNVASGTYSGLSSITTGGDIGNDHQDRDKAFYGLIDDVGVWDVALDADEVECIYLYGIPEQVFARAWNPNPGDEATGVATDKVLSWSAGDYADSHDVYFGTSESDANDADDSWPVATGPNDPNVYKGNQSGTTFDPCGLELGTTYFWRVDEVNDVTVCKGYVWSFTTVFGPPSKAGNPSPVNEVNNVDIYADLSWTAGAGATSHDVYFGTISPGASQGNQPGTTFDPGIMDANTTYYWRIDEKNAYGTTTGDVWSFTTGPPALPGYLVSWGNNIRGQQMVPPDEDFIAITPNGGGHGIAVKADCTLRAWGYDSRGQVTDCPTDGGYIACAAGNYHSAALKADGSLVSWGYNSQGQVSNTPTGNGFVAVVAGSYGSMALKNDGTVVAWANGSGGDMPSEAAYDVAMIAAMGYRRIVLKDDGTVVSWQTNGTREYPPVGAEPFKTIGSCWYNYLGIEADGTITGWGGTDPVVTNPPSDTDSVKIRGGTGWGLILKEDGSLKAWGGDPHGGDSGVPTDSGYIDITGGRHYGYALKPTGSVPPPVKSTVYIYRSMPCTVEGLEPGMEKDKFHIGKFLVHRGDPLTGSLTVYYSITPSSDADASDVVGGLSGSVTFGDGEFVRAIEIDALDDGIPDGDEQLILQLDPDPAYDIMSSRSEDFVWIADELDTCKGTWEL